MQLNYLVSQLYIYPVKGMGGIAVQEAFVTQRGLKYDRRWMLVDDDNQFISQRSFAHLCLFKLTFEKLGFKITYKQESVLVPFEIQEGAAAQVKIWEDEVEAIVADVEINTFFTKHLGINCKLVYMPDNSKRLVDSNYVKAPVNVSFADGYPILIIGNASLNLLNDKLAEPIEMNRFRPNVVFIGNEPHEEDAWHDFKIGGISMSGVKPCARCQVPTINQLTAEKGKEPLKTLATYRTVNNKINFGQNVIATTEGIIKVGDSIEIEN